MKDPHYSSINSMYKQQNFVFTYKLSLSYQFHMSSLQHPIIILQCICVTTTNVNNI
ncbi:hypothetical protein Hanom_Chr14g01318011 [Helianthus anomalus]